MEIKTFDTILTEICDFFDTLISPRTISRSNTNIIYLIFKAVAKGLEIINNVCVVLSNKFDPAKCSVEDLDSVASLVGTERLKGSASGLHVLVNNTKDTSLTLLAGTYTYKQSEEVLFEFEVLSDTVIEAESYVTFIAMSNDLGQYPVTAQAELQIESDREIADGLVFSCTDNEYLLGKLPETDIEFRKRILEGYTGQDSIVELENTLRNLPYLFDCRVRFNNSDTAQTYEGIEVPPYTAIIFYSGEVKNEIADKIADKILCPTVQTSDSVEVIYRNETLVSGEQSYYLIPFRKLEFTIEVIYKVNLEYLTNSKAQSEMRKALNLAFISEAHNSDYIKESDVYAALNEHNLAGLEVLDVNLSVGGVTMPYIEVPISHTPYLTSVNFVNAEA